MLIFNYKTIKHYDKNNKTCLKVLTNENILIVEYLSEEVLESPLCTQARR